MISYFTALDEKIKNYLRVKSDDSYLKQFFFITTSNGTIIYFINLLKKIYNRPNCKIGCWPSWIFKIVFPANK